MFYTVSIFFSIIPNTTITITTINMWMSLEIRSPFMIGMLPLICNLCFTRATPEKEDPGFQDMVASQNRGTPNSIDHPNGDHQILPPYSGKAPISTVSHHAAGGRAQFASPALPPRRRRKPTRQGSGGSQPVQRTIRVKRIIERISLIRIRIITATIGFKVCHLHGAALGLRFRE